MPCPNDARRRSVTIGFRMTPDEAEWLDDVVSESGLTKQEFIVAHLRDEMFTVVPNVRVQHALRRHMELLYVELSRLSAGDPVDERIAVSAERLTRLFYELGGNDYSTLPTSKCDEDLFGMER